MDKKSLCKSCFCRKFLYHQLHPEVPEDELDLPLEFHPDLEACIYVYHSAVATFHAPSDPSGIGGMRREIIRATSSWRKGPSRYDTIFIKKRMPDGKLPGMRGLHVGRVFLFFSLVFSNAIHSCALIQNFDLVDTEPDEDTGMWITKPEVNDEGHRPCEIVHLESIYHSAHLFGVYGKEFVPKDLWASDSLDAYRAFWVGKYIDYHAHGHVY